MITCPTCHTSNRDGSNFCNECGRPLNRAVAPPIVGDEGTVPPAAPAATQPSALVSQYARRANPPPSAAPPAAPPTRPLPTNPPPRPASSGCAGCGLVLLLGLLGLGAGLSVTLRREGARSH